MKFAQNLSDLALFAALKLRSCELNDFKVQYRNS